MTNPTQPAEGMPELKPCPWCGSSNIKMFSIMDGDERVEYAQCQDCTGMGPDHKSGRHWNSRTPRGPGRRQSGSGEIL